MINYTISTITAAAVCLAAQGADWPQFRGPNHDGTTSEKIPTKWPEAGLHEVWKTPLTDGFSSFAVGGGKVYTLVKREVDSAQQEVCVALDANTGKEVWSATLGIAKYDGGGDSGAPGNMGGDGPRSTPTYLDGKIYTYSTLMVLSCYNADDGKQIWSCDMRKEHAARKITWGSAASPVIDGDLIFVEGGGLGESLMAFDKKDGHQVWKAGDDMMTQSTPMPATILGQRQIIFFTQKGLVSVVPTTGAELWRLPMRYSGSAAISPVVSGDIVYCSLSYGVGSAACRISKTNDAFVATELWRSAGNKLSSHWSTPVVYNGCLYGIFGQANGGDPAAKFGKTPLMCIDLATGEPKWTQFGFGPGGVTLVDGGNLMVLSDAGDLVMVKAAPDAYTELDRTHILAGKCWNSIAICNGRIYARSTKEGVSLDVPGTAAAPAP